MSGTAWEQSYLDSHTCAFKQHRGEGWVSVIQRDRDYVRWLLDNIEEMDEELRECLAWGVDNVPDRI